jgi:hypothetical protein
LCNLVIILNNHIYNLHAADTSGVAWRLSLQIGHHFDELVEAHRYGVSLGIGAS